jgi:acyl-CoA synthetase (NDP forming)
MAVISGPGGLAVSSAEAIGRAGLKLAELTEDTKAALSKVVPPTGTSLRNPVDVGLTASLDMDIYIQAVRCTAQDENVDSMVIVGIGLDPEANKRFVAAMIEARQEFGKPFIMINVPGFDPALAGNYCQAGLPAFDSTERAMTTYAQIRRYQKWREAHS